MEQVPVAEVVVPVAEVASAEDASATLHPSKLVPALRGPGEADAHQASSSSSSRAPEEGHVPSSLPPISTARSSHSGNGAHGDSNKADVVDGDMDFTDAFPGNEGAAARLKERQRTERNRKREEERLEEEARRLREGEHKERRRLQQLRKLEKHVQSEEAEAKKAKEDLDRRIEEEQRLKNDEGSKAQQKEALVRIRARRAEVDKKSAKDRAEMEALAFAKAKKDLGQDLARKRLAHYSPRQRRLSSVTRQGPSSSTLHSGGTSVVGGCVIVVVLSHLFVGVDGASIHN
ncbi:unnamed protein product [Polarella glacialis]|uniref:Uncharacterized protein n=1 Tax=Polarella glacialis TaxID=89957 RepID=A0A813DLH4_POLGL|nr:unnamed protein product [Polarella glacialis]